MDGTFAALAIGSTTDEIRRADILEQLVLVMVLGRLLLLTSSGDNAPIFLLRGELVVLDFTA